MVWPDPLRNRFWETHPHYFDWLERDLEKHRERPTVVFQHVPVHPVGISPPDQLCRIGLCKTNLPAAGYHPRAFGEADFYGCPKPKEDEW